ncbi:disulfide bond formation protein DsbA [Marinitenerispora sediminis]|uniref:Disulfide bond formation protein DsbA n=1 Tax=Marinitenerispora sediminis TaxID=1931232 RepID=A0A368T3C5_9ACTN|nr:disulfide bond formation protein DsbA [Marinitenerispora sediminis]RCV52601.1 disulfide bond formation protein DsbA [Marinitenerispora sediminis]RCV56875.1 disulfide bond formation protein DsbA [Marinitenerispora sediminis]
MRVDVWSDIVCPWCYIGKRRLEAAIGRFEHAADVEVHWHSFQLDPDHPRDRREPVLDTLARKTGSPPDQVRAMTRQVTELAAAEGLAYALDRAVSVNTLDAHRLAHLAAEHGLGGRMHERLLGAHLGEGEVLDDPDTLVRLGAEVGVPEEEARRMLAGDAYAAEVAADIREARRLGVRGVPFFVLDHAYGVSGAQSADTFLRALRTAHDAAGAAGR